MLTNSDFQHKTGDNTPVFDVQHKTGDNTPVFYNCKQMVQSCTNKLTGNNRLLSHDNTPVFYNCKQMVQSCTN